MLQLVKVLKYNCETKETIEVEEEIDVMTTEEAEAKRLLDEANKLPTTEERLTTVETVQDEVVDTLAGLVGVVV